MNQKPGEKPKHQGPHHEQGPRGGDTGNEAKIKPRPNEPKKDHLPPTQKPSETWKPPKK